MIPKTSKNAKITKTQFFQMTVISMTALFAITKVDIYWENLKNLFLEVLQRNINSSSGRIFSNS